MGTHTGDRPSKNMGKLVNTHIVGELVNFAHQKQFSLEWRLDQRRHNTSLKD